MKPLFGMLVLLACAGAMAAPPAAPALPTALRQPAVVTPKALGAGMLAVTRAGRRLVAAGERGIVLWSDDEGRQWHQATVPVQATLTAVRFVDAHTGWAVGHLGVVLRSDDGGMTWVRQLDGVGAAALVLAEAQATGDAAAVHRAERFVDEGPDKPFFDIAFTDAQHAWVVGAYGLILATDDGGKTWRSLQTRLENTLGVHLYAVQVLGQALFVAGEQGLLARSDDGGGRFTALSSPYKGSFFGLLSTRDGALLAYGLRGNVFRSSDGGLQWRQVETGLPVSIGAGVTLGDGRVVLLAQNGDLLVSRDGGTTLARVVAPRPLPAAGLTSVDRGEVLLASLRGLQRAPLP